jgi:hypothetical protein
MKFFIKWLLIGFFTVIFGAIAVWAIDEFFFP